MKKIISTKLLFLSFLLSSCYIANAQTAFTAPTTAIVSGSALAPYTAAQIEPFVNVTAPSFTQTWQGTTNRRLTGFTVGAEVYSRSISQTPDQVIFRKNNSSGNNTTHNGGTLFTGQQATPWNDRQLFFAEGTVNNTASTATLVTSYPGTYNSATSLQQNVAFVNGYWNYGTDNTFCNLEINNAGAGAGNATASNNERIDVLWTGGIPVTATNLSKSGIVLSFRGPTNDDPIKVSAIKGLTGGGNIGGGTNYIYDDLLSYNSSWTTKTVNGGTAAASATPTVIGNIATVVLRRNDNDGAINDQVTAASNPTITNVLAAQNINAIFLTFADLGLTVGDTFYGYSIMPTDAVPGTSPTSNQINSYLNNAYFPNNTNATDGGADLSSLNGFFVAASIILPIRLISFTAAKQSKTSLLQWATATEQNNKGFEIERSANGANWVNIGFVKSQAIDGNSSTRLDYSFTDNTPLTGNNYYHLKQTDLDGRYEYSPVKAVRFDLDKGISLYPNPAKENITLSGLQGGEIIQLFDISGRNLSNTVSNTTHSISVANLSEGVYYLKIIKVDGSSQTIKFLKIK